MSEGPGRGWWLASDGRWYPPELHPDASAPPPPPPAAASLPPGTYRVSGPGARPPSGRRSPQRGNARAIAVVGLVVVVLLVGLAVEVNVVQTHLAPTDGSAISVPGQPTNILPQPDFLGSCSAVAYDDSSGCVDAVVAALTRAHQKEGLGPFVLPSNWDRLTPAEQLFVATNLERTAHGLTPMAGLAQALDVVAGQGATSGGDPQLPAEGSFSVVGSNWIQGYSSPLEALYEWVYDDGLGSTNVECTRHSLGRCWGHRANVLLQLECPVCVMGTAYSPSDTQGQHLCYAEVLVQSSASLPLVFTWAQEQPYLG